MANNNERNMMTKAAAINYIEVVGYTHETATEMVKDLPDEFDTEDTVIPGDVYDAIMEGVHLNTRGVKMSRFIIHWLTGSSEIVAGETIARAFTAAGYGAGALNAVDWYEECH